MILGKTSSSVTVTSSNGEIYVSDYLEKILKFFGSIYIGDLEITIDQPPMLEEDNAQTIVLIEKFVEKVEQSLTGEFPLKDLEMQIQAFKTQKEIYSSENVKGFEGQAWKTWPELLHNSFLDAWQYQKMVSEYEEER